MSSRGWHLGLLCAAAFSVAVPARADLARVSEPARWALGFMLGAPTGLTVKRYLGGANALDLGLGFALGPGFRIHADHLWGLARIPTESANVSLNLYAGVGPMLGAFSGTCGFISSARCGGGLAYAGFRVPFGLDAVFRRTPFALAVELAPGFAATSAGVGGTFDLFIAGRFLL